jgi:hypothetical protein
MPLLKPIRAHQINWSHPLARGLTGCWLLNEATGEKVADCGLGRNNGSFAYASTPPLWKPGKHGPCVEFGTDCCIDCGTGKFGWDVTNEVSVVALVNHSTSQTNTIFTRSSYVRPVRLHAQSGGRASWRVYTDGTDCLITSTSSHATDGTEWVHVAGTWRVGDGRLYVNGALEVSESSSTGILNTIDNQFVGIGGTYGGSNYLYCWNGKIEYVFVYNRALSAEEVRWLRREPFAMFAESISPASIHVPSTIVPLAGLAGAVSTATASLKTISGLLSTEMCWLRGALYNGMTANAFKLGTTLSLGWFWARVAGCSALYRKSSMELIDFDNILTVAELNAVNISPPGYLPHNNNSTYFYVIRRFNHCGYRENTLAAAKVSLNASGELVKPQPNKIFAVKAEQAVDCRIRLTWFYCPLEQSSPPICFNVYYDNRTGQIDFNSVLAKVTYRGQRYYSYQSNTLEAGKYLFAVRAEDSDGTEDSSSAQLSVQLDTASIDPINIVSVEKV